MTTVTWSPRATQQLIDAIDYIAQDDLAAAYRVRDTVVERVNLLTEFPELGRPGRSRGSRELVITGTSYIAVYRVNGSNIEIAKLWHSAQSRRR